MCGLRLYTASPCGRHVLRPAAGKRLLQRNGCRPAKAMHTFTYDPREPAATIHKCARVAHVHEVLVGCVVPPVGNIVTCVQLCVQITHHSNFDGDVRVTRVAHWRSGAR